MNADISQHIHTTALENPTVRIDAQNPAYAEPLRKYFSAYGYAVFINRPSENPIFYHIVLGDEHFVKTFLQDQQKSDVKRLVIVWNAYPEDMRMYASPHVKIALIDRDEITDHDVRTLFQFYFTARETFTDLRIQKTPAPVQETIRVQESTETPLSDEQETIGKPPETEAQVDMGEPHQDRETDMRNAIPEEQEEDRLRIEALVQDVYKTDTKPRESPTSRTTIRSLSLVAILLLIPFIWYGIHLGVSGVAAYVGSRFLVSGNEKDASSISRIGLFSVSQARLTIPFISIPFKLVGRSESVATQERLVTVIENILKAEIDAAEIADVGRELSVAFLSPAGSDPTALAPASGIERMQRTVSFINHRLGVADAMLQTITTDGSTLLSLPLLRALWQRFGDSVTEIRTTTAQLERLLVLYPYIAGFRQTQTYLVLLQNTMELRPTGGFIGSLALAQTRDGRLSDLTVQDVYAVDGQLKGHVDPPVPIRDLLGQEHWYLRDSNWDPDFRISGERARWFYEKETGTAVDGVIGISVPYIIDLLKATGPIDLPDIQDRITAENFFGKSLFYTQNDFFPGSTQKKDFLGYLISSLVLKITQDRRISPAALSAATVRALTQRNILFSFADPNIRALVSHYGWDGAMNLDAGCSGSLNDCIGEGIALIDANLSVNKTNYYLKTSRIRLIEIGNDGSINETNTFQYRNTSTADDQGGGAYRSYTRLYLPSDSTVTGIFLDGAPVTEKQEATTAAQLLLPYWEAASATESGRAVGVAFEVPEEETRNLSVTFRRGIVIPSTGTPIELGVYDYKQPGISDSEEHLLIRYPLSFAATVHDLRGGEQRDGEDSRFFLAKQGQLEYNTTLSSDFSLRVTLEHQ